MASLDTVGRDDVALAGGKGAKLGELPRAGFAVPPGFVVTTHAYDLAVDHAGLCERLATLPSIDTSDAGAVALVSRVIREAFAATPAPATVADAVRIAYRRLGSGPVAVRSSATAEDLPGASFAGEQETYLHIKGAEEVVTAVRAVMASLFTDRAISYRADRGFDHMKVALSAGVQKMVRSDLGASGVMFTVDTESGFKNVVLINGSWGLGEMIVQGEVTPDEFLVYKPNLGVGTRLGKNKDAKVLKPVIDRKLGVKERKMIYSVGHGIKTTKIVPTSDKERSSFVLSEKEIVELARWGALIEKHYSDKNHKWMPMDIEWAKDGRSHELYIVQSRPETVQAGRDFSKIKEYERKPGGKVVTKGYSVGSRIASGKARVILSAKNMGDFKPGEVLVTDMTDPDWEWVMKIAAAIVTNKGGRTSHAAIVSRELGIPCVVGTENATKRVRPGDAVTVDTTGTEGLVLEGALKFKVEERDVRKLPKPKVKVMVNIATPDSAFEKSFLPVQGVGLAREEFIIAGTIGVHPMALINFDKLRDKKLKAAIEGKMRGWKSPAQFYVDKLAYGIAKIAAAFDPYDVIVRFSDFKTNEYRALLGGDLYEPKEENPMIGWRGASRYYNPNFSPAFALEVKAMKKVREEIGLRNVVPMIPFCRTPEEGEKVVAEMAKYGLKRSAKTPRSARGDKDLRIFVMCEIPSNVILADRFLDVFDGMSIGSNDLTQLTVGIDRDGNDRIRGIANENDESVKTLVRDVIRAAKRRKKYIGICGQAPSDYPEFAEFIAKEGIESMSLNPDTVIKTILKIAKGH
ncbi:phosphoenolpyruvate synthase [Patescibacteria group bacterium]|nr:phosphoenolpyruvate synthase [Patescibacteria group bacterium]